MRILYFTLAAALGAGSYLIYHHLSAPRDEVVTAGRAPGPARDVGRILAPGPILSDDLPPEADEDAAAAPAPPREAPARPETAEASPPPAAATVEAPAAPPEEKKEEARPAPPPPSGAGQRPPGQPGVAFASDVEEMTRLARAAFDAGDALRGAKLLREVFRAARDRSDIDVVSQARQLLEVEERGANDRPASSDGSADADRVDLYRYLAARDSDPAWRFRSTLGLGAAETRAGSPESMRAGWERLTTAYLEASSASQRGQVLAVLDPFVKRNVFSKRFSPLVATYTVKASDSLNKIARSRGTTEEALVRLNQLRDTVIQPGQRLILLEGKPGIFVKKSEFRLWLMAGERLVMECPVGLGRDNSTPATTFQIGVRQKDPIWYPTGERPIPAGDPRNILGTRWLGFKETKEGLTGFGIHGTADPSSIGKEESSGCIRMRNGDVEVLWDLVPIGTEVKVLE